MAHVDDETFTVDAECRTARATVRGHAGAQNESATEADHPPGWGATPKIGPRCTCAGLRAARSELSASTTSSGAHTKAPTSKPIPAEYVT